MGKETTNDSRHVHVAIARKPEEVYAFAVDPVNLPRWAAGLSEGTIEREGDHWIANSPMGRVRIRFAPRNAFGVMDHDVTLPSGETVHNAFRVIPNGDGSEVIFSLFRSHRTSAADFERDAGMVENDLRTLKAQLEK